MSDAALDILKRLENSQGNRKATVDVLKTALKSDVAIPEHALKASLDSMSTTIEGATSGILYSGKFGNRSAYEAANEMVTNSNEIIAIIDQTDAFKLLESDAFQDAYKLTNPKDFDVLFDKVPRTGPNSLWDDISRKFVAGLQGDVVTITPNADARRVFAQTELPALLENPNVTKINGVDKTAYSGRYIQLTAQGILPEDAIAKINHDLVKLSSTGFIKGQPDIADELGTTLRHDFKHAAKDSLRHAYNGAANPDTAQIGLDHNAPKASMLGKYGGTVAGVAVGVGATAYALTSGSSTVQAAEVFYETAVPYGEAQTKAVQGDMQGAAQAAVVETASNMAFGACAVQGAVVGATGGSVAPVLGTVIGGGVGALTAGVACAVGAGMATDYALDHAASMIQRQAIYDALPVLDMSANDALYDERNPIHAYPAAHDMALIKTQIVGTQGMIAQVNDGTKEPFNGMNKGESAQFLQERIVRLEDRFADTYNQAKADDTLDEVIEYATQYGVDNMQAAQQQNITLHNTPVANDTTYTARALGMR